MMKILLFKHEFLFFYYLSNGYPFYYLFSAHYVVICTAFSHYFLSIFQKCFVSSFTTGDFVHALGKLHCLCCYCVTSPLWRCMECCLYCITIPLPHPLRYMKCSTIPLIADLHVIRDHTLWYIWICKPM